MSDPEQYIREKPLILSPTAARRMHLLLRGKGLETGSEHEQGLLQHVLDRQNVLKEACTKTDDSKTEEKYIASVECNASILDKHVALAREILLCESEENENGAVCRHMMHDCVASQDILDRLTVRSGDLVEVSNTERPNCIPRLARIWLDDCKDGSSETEAKISPFLAYNIGIPYHVLPFVDNGTSPQCNEKSFRVSLVRYNGRHYQEISKDGDVEHIGIANPSTSYVTMPVASEVVLSVIREPAIDGDLQPQGDEEDALKDKEEMDMVKHSGMEPDADEASECIHVYFGQDVQILSRGDILAIRVPESNRMRPGGLISVLNNLVEDAQAGRIQSSDAWDTSSGSVLYFKVTEMTPRQPAIQAVNIKHTTVKLGGIIPSGIPVGARGYLSGSGDFSKFLGWAWDASWSPNAAHLAHVGHLLPHWRNVADIIAPVIHPLSSRIPMRCSILLHGPAGSGKRTAATAAAAALGCHLISISCQDIKVEGIPDEKVIEGLQAVVTIASGYRPVLLLLRDLHLLAPLNHPNAVSQAAKIGSALSKCIIQGFQEGDKNAMDNTDYFPFPTPLIVIGCAPSVDDIGAGIRRCFTHEVACEAPETAERELLLRSYLRSAGKTLSDDSWSNLVRHTAGLFPLDLKSMAAEACSCAALEACTDVEDVMDKSTRAAEESFLTNAVPVQSIEERHIESSITCVRERTATDIGAPRIPNVQWDDVGGLEDVKLAILDTVELPLKHPALFAGGLRRRSGVLLYGPPGTGKTLLAKAVATECAVNFLSVKGPELINMYVGESERLVREVFIRARRARPCVIFFDELDSLAPARGRGSDSGGVMDRIVSQLLAEIDCAQGGSGTDDIFIIGATNRPDLLDPALLRPGRLDKLLYVGIAAEPSDRLKVLSALTRKFCLASDVDLVAISAACPSRLTGADMYGLCSSAWMIGLKRHIASNPSKTDSSIIVNHQDFLDALSSIQPSLTINDILQYEQLQQSYVH